MDDATLGNIVTYVFWITAATFIFTWVFNNTRKSIPMAVLLRGTMDVFPNAFLLPHLPAAGEMTELGVLAMYLGLAAGFGVFSLFLIAVGGSATRVEACVPPRAFPDQMESSDRRGIAPSH
ncbi:MAG: amino terminal protease family protein [Microvirga sp.]|jgi:hypothetical protein|nr:amino terminal protease family protein [Microvirga sp.]